MRRGVGLGYRWVWQVTKFMESNIHSIKKKSFCDVCILLLTFSVEVLPVLFSED